MTAAWLLWLAAVLIVSFGGFAVLESYAFAHNKRTFSRLVYDASKAWPVLPFAVGLALGLLQGGLAVHFWWIWNPT